MFCCVTCYLAISGYFLHFVMPMYFLYVILFVYQSDCIGYLLVEIFQSGGLSTVVLYTSYIIVLVVLTSKIFIHIQMNEYFLDKKEQYKAHIAHQLTDYHFRLFQQAGRLLLFFLNLGRYIPDVGKKLMKKIGVWSSTNPGGRKTKKNRRAKASR